MKQRMNIYNTYASIAVSFILGSRDKRMDEMRVCNFILSHSRLSDSRRARLEVARFNAAVRIGELNQEENYWLGLLHQTQTKP